MGKIKHSNWHYMGKCLSNHTKPQLISILESLMSQERTRKQDLNDALDKIEALEWDVARMKARTWWKLWAR